MEFFEYILLTSAFGTLGVVWQKDGMGPRVHRVYLPKEDISTQRRVLAAFAGAGLGSCTTIEALGSRMTRFLEGEAVDFPLDLIALERCSAFQRNVLLAEHKVPRGYVSTYGRIAKTLGIPGGARAVGNALSRNPFPILIPCHRAVKSSGELGGFQGGLQMKRKLLELEGIKFSQTGRVCEAKIYF
jgi:methylated-DNA-[protein]-cysteine S-methyltransferase